MDKSAIAAAFGRAASTYDAVSEVQALAARRLAALLQGGAANPAILDLGCGTGHLALALRTHDPAAAITLADIAPPMLAAARAKLDLPAVAADAEQLPFAPQSFDIIASNLALQWVENLPATLQSLARLLKPGGTLAVTTLLDQSWSEWRAAHRALGLESAMQRFPSESALRAALPFAHAITTATILRPYRKGREFLRDIARLGAGARAGDALPPRDLSRVISQFESQGAVASYQIATIVIRRPARPAIFVGGTDTGVGKTVVSAILARAWGADYWKPAQTGLADDPGDTAFQTALGIAAHPPLLQLQAALSPYDAALLENRRIAITDFTLPQTAKTLVVEGAGGVASPLDETHDMADLAAYWGLPVVLVARSTLGTINHTITAIEHLRARGLCILGVVMVGPPNPANRAEITRRAKVDILLECPIFEALDPKTITEAAMQLPDLRQLGEALLGDGNWFINC